MSAVPFKANAGGRHHIPRQLQRVTNWSPQGVRHQRCPCW